MHKQGMLADALRHYEAHLQLAEASGTPATVRAAHGYLLAPRSAMAEAAMQEGEAGTAQTHLQACLAAAAACDDAAAAAATLHQLGRLMQKQRRWQEAIEFQQRFLDQAATVRATAATHHLPPRHSVRPRLHS
jgi:tetratricopeptide (TPR) repeat protein